MDAEPSGHRSGRPNVAQCPRDASAGGHAAGSDLIEAFLRSPREIDVHARKGTCVRNTLPMFRGFATAKVLVSSIGDRKSTRLNSSHLVISYAVFCLKKKK